MRLPDEDVYGEIMQQADVSALRLFEALVVTLPETLLQTYVLICTDIGIKSPGRARVNRSLLVFSRMRRSEEAYMVLSVMVVKVCPVFVEVVKCLHVKDSQID